MTDLAMVEFGGELEAELCGKSQGTLFSISNVGTEYFTSL